MKSKAALSLAAILSVICLIFVLPQSQQSSRTTTNVVELKQSIQKKARRVNAFKRLDVMPDFRRAEAPYVEVQHPLLVTGDHCREIEQAVRSGEPFSFQLPDGTELRAVSQRVRDLNKGFTSFGKVGDFEAGTYALTVYDGVLTASIVPESGLAYQIKLNHPGVHEIRSVDRADIQGGCAGFTRAMAQHQERFPDRVYPSRLGSSKGDTTKFAADVNSHAKAVAGSSVVSTEDVIAIAAAEAEVTQDLVVGYSASALSFAGGTEAGMISLIQTTVTETNSLYSNSNADMEVYLLHASQMQATDDILSDIDNIKVSNGQLDELGQKRDEYGADLATLWHTYAAGGFGILGVAAEILNDVENDASVGFACVDVGTAGGAGGYTFAHELGHCQGCQHDLASPVGTEPKYKSYAYGYIMPDGRGTIMAYAENYIPHFSNPAVSFSGNPTGTNTPSGPNNGTTDNARRLNETRTIVANWRQRKKDDFAGGGNTPGGTTGDNQPPVIDIDKSQTVWVEESLPVTVPLNSSVWDDGLPSGTLTYSWDYLSGPGRAYFSIVDSTASSTSATLAEYGTYVFSCTVSDGQYADTDIIAITISEPFVSSIAQVVEYLRLYNPSNGHHHFTVHYPEYSALQGIGWKGEGVACKVVGSPTPFTASWYRLYNPKTGGHLWTTDRDEYNSLPLHGWVQEGVPCYVYKQERDKTIPYYRLFNPNSGHHLYTVSAVEYQVLGNLGWNREGAACYVYPASHTAVLTSDESASEPSEAQSSASAVTSVILDNFKTSGASGKASLASYSISDKYTVTLDNGSSVTVYVSYGDPEEIKSIGEGVFSLQTEEEDIPELLLELIDDAVEVSAG